MGNQHRAAGRAGLLWLALAGLAALSAPAAAAIRVEVNGVDATLRRNVLALLSVEHYKDRDRIEPDAVQRLFRRVDSEVRDALKPYGYYNPSVESTLTQEQGNWRVQINIRPGDPVMVEEVSIILHGAGATDSVFTRVVAKPALVKGRRLEHPAYDKTKSDLQSAAATYGYLDARLLRSELQVDPQRRTARAFLELETGERYKFGPTTLDQSAIRESQLRRYLRYQEGELFDAGKLLRTQFALDDSRFFSAIEVTTGERDQVNHVVPINISGKRARNTYSFGAGYGTDTGIRGTISWLNPLVNDRGHRLRVWLELSERTQNLNARYDVPFGDPVLEKFSVQFLTQSEQTSGAVNTHEDSVTPSITQNLGHWQRVLSMAFMHTITDDAVNGHLVDDLIVPGITYASVPKDYLGEELFSRTLYAELIGSNKVLGSNSNFLRLDVRSERVLNVSQHWHLYLRGEVGASAVGDFQDLPGTFRFYAGGDRSVRGFAYNELSPVQTAADGVTKVRVGGRHLITGTVEIVRDLPRLMGIAAFTDFGNAINNLGEPLAASVGVGLRWRLPVVTIGFDIAKAVRAPGFAEIPGPRLHINISPQL